MTGTTSITYDVNDAVASVAATNTATPSFEYDDLGNLLQGNQSRSRNYVYDEAGNVISKADARGKVTTYANNALNRLVTETAFSGQRGRFTRLNQEGSDWLRRMAISICPQRPGFSSLRRSGS